VKVNGKALPNDDNIISIMGRYIPPEWIFNLLALGNDPWKFKDVKDQLATYRQHWQSDQQSQIMIKMTGKRPDKSMDGKCKNNEQNNHNNAGGSSVGRQGNNGCGGGGRGRGGRGEGKYDINHHLKMSYPTAATKMVNIRLIVCAQENGNEESNMVFEIDPFQKGKPENDKNNMKLDDKSLDMSVFDKLMEDKHNKIVSEINDVSISIKNTNNLFHFERLIRLINLIFKK
jgi:hypothetical protein